MDGGTPSVTDYSSLPTLALVLIDLSLVKPGLFTPEWINLADW